MSDDLLGNPIVSTSPLRFPGGKSKVVEVLRKHLPDDLRELASPFLGGGSFELHCLSHGIRVFANDAFPPLATFWQKLLEDPVRVADLAAGHLPAMSDAYHRSLRKSKLECYDEWGVAGGYYALNRASFSGKAFRGYSRGHKSFNEKLLDELREFKAPGLSVSNEDFEPFLARHSDRFIFLDPPYPVKDDDLYGWGGRDEFHHAFDHERLARIICQRKGWMLTYNDDPLILKLYKNCRIVPNTFKYSLAAAKGKERRFIREDVIILPK